jgi:hypothetical protein
MRFDRAPAQIEQACDLAIRFTANDQRRNLSLPIR